MKFPHCCRIESDLKAGIHIRRNSFYEYLKRQFLAHKWCNKCLDRNHYKIKYWNDQSAGDLPIKVDEEEGWFKYAFVVCNPCREVLMDTLFMDTSYFLPKFT
jgi:hypothetical protein